MSSFRAVDAELPLSDAEAAAQSPAGGKLGRRSFVAAVAIAAAVPIATAATPASAHDAGHGHGPSHPHQPAEPDFGPNVKVFSPDTPTAEIQAALDAAAAVQVPAEFGTGRFAFLFKPGTYNVDAQLGYYTSIAGLGLHPDDVTINGAVRVEGQDQPGGGDSALTNFWRSAENLAVVPTGDVDWWAVSQAAPLRRVHIRGQLFLFPRKGGFASGGYIADSLVDEQVLNASQQQWMTRNSTIGSWSNGVWNQVFSGVQGAPAQSFPSPPYTTLPTTPLSRESPSCTWMSTAATRSSCPPYGRTASALRGRAAQPPAPRCPSTGSSSPSRPTLSGRSTRHSPRANTSSLPRASTSSPTPSR